MRAAFSAVTIAIAVCAAAPAFADAQSHAQAARKAEKRGEWRKALAEWKAAYSADVNAEYLIGIGDAYGHLGNKTEAKKSYDAYLADPLALPANVEKVKSKLAALNSSASDALALPGPGLPLPGASDMLPLPGLATASNEKKADPGLDLGQLTLPAKKEPEKKVAAASPALELPLPGIAPAKPAEPAKAKEQQVAAAAAPQRTSSASASKPIAAVTPKPPDRKPAPDAAIAETPVRGPSSSSGSATRVVAFVAAGVAVAALGGGALAFSKANSAHSDLTGRVHDGATAQQLLGDEQRNKTLSFVGLAGGLVAAGVATALFVF